MSRAEVVLAGIVSFCLTALIGTIGVHCQLATRDIRSTCLEQGQPAHECARMGVGG